MSSITNVNNFLTLNQLHTFLCLKLALFNSPQRVFRRRWNTRSQMVAVLPSQTISQNNYGPSKRTSSTDKATLYRIFYKRVCTRVKAYVQAHTRDRQRNKNESVLSREPHVEVKMISRLVIVISPTTLHC